MKKVIISIIVAIILIAAGGAICGMAYVQMDGSFAAMSFADMELDEIEVTEEFKDIEAAVNIGNVTIRRSDEADCYVERYQDKKAPFEVSVENGKLLITQKERKNVPWYEYLSLLADIPRVVVFLPKEEYGDIALKTDTGKIAAVGELSSDSMSLTSETGDISISDMACKRQLSANTDTGEIKISDTTCSDLKMQGETSSMQLRDVVSAGTFDIVTETGSIKFDDCDASQITAQVETGSITGTLRSSKRFEAKVETGSVHVPKDTYGGLCKLKTETGEIRISIDD